MTLRQVVIGLIASTVFASTFIVHAQQDSQRSSQLQTPIKGPKSATPQYSGSTYGPITSSDTLWKIASRYRQNQRLSVYQVMQAIYDLNPDAFEEQNFNHMVDGAILNMPSERYIARIDVEAARLKAQMDDKNWKPGSGDTKSAAIPAKPPETAASKEDLTQTKVDLEARLSALDQEQNRQFMAIRQQFAESITSVQSLLDENQKLYERLDAVNEDIDGLRTRVDDEIQLQIEQILQMQNELLNMSRQAEAQRQAEMNKSSFDWLTSPAMLISLSVLITLGALAGLAVWIMRRKSPQSDIEEFAPVTLPPEAEPVNSELDDLSDALSDELSGELEEDEGTDDLFGEDDLLDDVLSEELQESLDEALDEEVNEFDELDEEMLVPDSAAEEGIEEDELELGDSALNQDELDSLFDEDDVLGGDEEMESIDLSETDELGEVDADSQQQELESLLDEDAEPAPEERPAVDTEGADYEVIEDGKDKSLSPVAEESDKPEISIDELLEEQEPALPESIQAQESEDVTVEMLQQIDEEITSQNQELDQITDELLMEIEQLELMGEMLPEDAEDEDEETEVSDADAQHAIQQLDDLSEGLDDDLDDVDASVPDMEMLADEPGDIEPDEQDMLADELLAEIEQEQQEPDAPESDLEEPSADESADLDEQDALADELLAEIEQEQAEQTVPEFNVGEAAADESANADEQDALADELLAEIEQEQAELDVPESDEEVPTADESADADEQDASADELLEELEQDFPQDVVADEVEEEAEANTDEFDKALADFEQDIDDADLMEDNDLEAEPEEELPAPEEQHEDETQEDAPRVEPELDDLEDIPSFGEMASFDEEEPSDLAATEQTLDSAVDEDSPEAKAIESELSELDDVPGLGDWLEKADNEDEVSLQELEDASFDELLESIDEPEAPVDEQEAEKLATDDLDLEALLNEDVAIDTPEDVTDVSEEDFLDVDALLTESLEAESEPMDEKALDLDVSLEDYTGVKDDDDVIDVDSDEGVGAKLDLARAYIEMDDNESARELLEEVLKKGGEEQQEEARTILDKLS